MIHISDYGETESSFRKAFYDRCERAIANEGPVQCKAVDRDVQSTIDNYGRVIDAWRAEADESIDPYKTFGMTEAHECMTAKDTVQAALSTPVPSQMTR